MDDRPSNESPPRPRGFPGGVVRIVGTVGEDGRVTLTAPLRRPPASDESPGDDL